MTTSWVLSNSPIEEDRLGNFSLIHSDGEAHLYADSQSNRIETSFGFFILNGYLLPRSSVHQQFEHVADLIEFLWMEHGLNWKSHVKGVFSLVGFFDNKWFVLNDNLGLSKIYWTTDRKFLSNSFDSLAILCDEVIWNKSAILSREYFHRDIGEITIIKGIRKSRSGVFIVFSNLLFQKEYYFDYDHLRNLAVDSNVSPNDFITIWEKLFLDMEKFFPNAEHVITLTGGKDARTGLALLKHFDKIITGLTYGVPESKDAVFAARLARKSGIQHVIPVLPQSSTQWRQNVQVCADVDSSYISPHRALRAHALHSVLAEKKSPWYWGGYMGGEWLMGLYADGLVFPKWLTDFNLNQSMGDVVFQSREVTHEEEDLKEEIDRIQCAVNRVQSKQELQLIWMFEIGVLHHGQDIELAATCGARPYPFLMDIDFIEQLFRSRFSFFFQDHDTKNLFKRWKLYEWNIRIQQKLMPDWGDVPFGKKGEYTANVFMKGSLFWAFYKTIHYILERKTYPSSFSYTESWREMYLDIFNAASDMEIPFYSEFEREQLRDSLAQCPLPTVEKSWLRYSRLVMVYLQYEKICRLRNGSQYHHPKK